MKAIKLIGLSLGLTLLNTVHAAGIWINGRSAITHEHGSGRSYRSGETQITFQNEELPWGSQVYLISGIRTMWKGSWYNRSVQAMTSVSPYTWQMSAKHYFRGNDSMGPVSHLEFVFEVHLPDGQVYFDNGWRSDSSFYSVTLPYEARQPIDLDIQIRHSIYDY